MTWNCVGRNRLKLEAAERLEKGAVGLGGRWRWVRKGAVDLSGSFRGWVQKGVVGLGGCGEGGVVGQYGCGHSWGKGAVFTRWVLVLDKGGKGPVGRLM